MELCLGTVQFGLDYGVFNTPKKDKEYCIKCLEYAIDNGIKAIDTATAYGNAEEIVGEFIKRNKHKIKREELFISTKLLPNVLDNVSPSDYVNVIRDNLKKSLKTLNLDYVDAYLLHSSRYAFNKEILDALSVMKSEGLARSVGVSVYYPEEAIECFKNKNIDYLQAPYSVFDHRMEESNIFKLAIDNNFRIDTRTAFIKGLIRLKVDEVPEHLSKAKPILTKLDEICNKTGYSRIELAIGYIKREKNINHLVFGIRNIEQLKEDIEAFNKNIPDDVLEMLDNAFKDIDHDLIIPSLWKK